MSEFKTILLNRNSKAVKSENLKSENKWRQAGKGTAKINEQEIIKSDGQKRMEQGMANTCVAWN